MRGNSWTVSSQQTQPARSAQWLPRPGSSSSATNARQNKSGNIRPVAIRIVRLGSERAQGEGLRIGTVRRPPRGVRKDDYASRNIYDVWFPNLSPSETLLKTVGSTVDGKSWRAFKRSFLAEMKEPRAKRDLDLLAALSHQTNFSIGCYCEDKTLCHRSILEELLVARDADLKKDKVIG